MTRLRHITGRRFPASRLARKSEDELNMLYQIVVDDIRFTKRQQWTVPYYCFLLFSALVAYVSLRSEQFQIPTNLPEKWFLILIDWSIAIFGTNYLIDCQLYGMG